MIRTLLTVPQYDLDIIVYIFNACVFICLFVTMVAMVKVAMVKVAMVKVAMVDIVAMVKVAHAMAVMAYFEKVSTAIARLAPLSKKCSSHTERKEGSLPNLGIGWYC